MGMGRTVGSRSRKSLNLCRSGQIRDVGCDWEPTAAFVMAAASKIASRPAAAADDGVSLSVKSFASGSQPGHPNPPPMFRTTRRLMSQTVMLGGLAEGFAVGASGVDEFEWGRVGLGIGTRRKRGTGNR